MPSLFSRSKQVLLRCRAVIAACAIGGALLLISLDRIKFICSVMGAMPTLAVGMFHRENHCMATPAWPWHPLHLYLMRSSAPRFDEQGKLSKPAYITVLQNGVLVQNHFEIRGATSNTEPPKYTAHPAKTPLQLQYHNNKVRYRNIWIREL